MTKDDYGRHELVDRTSIIINNFNDYIMDHYLIKGRNNDEPLIKLINEIDDALGELYVRLANLGV